MPNKKTSLIQNALSVGVLCGILALLWCSSCGSFEACSNNPCGDDVYCNGFVVCTIEGALSVCSGVVPIECGEGMVCSEEARACVAE